MLGKVRFVYPDKLGLLDLERILHDQNSAFYIHPFKRLQKAGRILGWRNCPMVRLLRIMFLGKKIWVKRRAGYAGVDQSAVVVGLRHLIPTREWGSDDSHTCAYDEPVLRSKIEYYIREAITSSAFKFVVHVTYDSDHETLIALALKVHTHSALSHR